MSESAHPRRSIRFRNRSYLAFVLTPEPPIFEWLASLDAWLSGSPDFFVGKPVVLDLSIVVLSESGMRHLMAELQARGIRLMGIEATEPPELGPELPPLLKGGRSAGAIEPLQLQAHEQSAEPPAREEPASLVLEDTVRSGQSVVFPRGDVTILGSVASGAEIIAGGSIHIYGTLRGRAIAGLNGNPSARIFCNRVEAELLSIDGLYRTAEHIDSSLRSRPIQAWLKGDVMFIAPLN